MTILKIPLDKQGQKDAIMIGNQLLSLGWKPDRIMVSPSIRTMETLNLMGEDFTKAKIFQMMNSLGRSILYKIV